MPADWDPERSWPLLVELTCPARNPHTTVAEPCIAVLANERVVGYFTPKMTARFASAISACMTAHERATAVATAARGAKGGAAIWRVKVSMSADATDRG